MSEEDCPPFHGRDEDCRLFHGVLSSQSKSDEGRSIGHCRGDGGGGGCLLGELF